MNIAVVVPVLNASGEWSEFASALSANIESMGLPREQVLIIDSSSADGTPELVRHEGFRFHQIARSAFNHGATRHLAIELMPEAEILVYLTQDAILADPTSISSLIHAFNDPKTGAAYGRQLPKPNANPIEAHARIFNYPDKSCIRNLDSRKQLGFKSIFFSNSFGAYRRAALLAVGGFSSDMIFGEDTIVTARLHLNGWNTAYVADAAVYHSHPYSLLQEFRRYFDIGVLHCRESRLFDLFGGASGEGKRFVQSELTYLAAKAPALIPSALIRNVLKLTAFRLGRNERVISDQLKKHLTMNRTYWNRSVDPPP